MHGDSHDTMQTPSETSTVAVARIPSVVFVRGDISLSWLSTTTSPCASRLEVAAKNGDTYRFIVRERDLWMAMLASAGRQSTAAPTARS